MTLVSEPYWEIWQTIHAPHVLSNDLWS